MAKPLNNDSQFSWFLATHERYHKNSPDQLVRANTDNFMALVDIQTKAGQIARDRQHILSTIVEPRCSMKALHQCVKADITIVLPPTGFV